MDESIRSYKCNLVFNSNGINDIKNPNWVCYNNDTISKENFDFTKESPIIDSGKIPNTVMTVSKDGSHLRNKKLIDLSPEEKYTLSLRFKIDHNFVVNAIVIGQIVPGVWWYDGEILLLDKSRYVPDGNCITIWIKNTRFELPVSYLSSNDFYHVLISLDHGLLSIYLNGSMYVNKTIQNPSYKFEDLKIGNYKRNLKSGEKLPDVYELYDPIVHYDEFAIVNDILYTDQFDAPNHYLQYLFPESVLKNDDIKFSSGYRDSVADKLNSFDIVRHRNYQPPKTYRDNFVTKYDFDNDSKDEKSAYYKKY